MPETETETKTKTKAAAVAEAIAPLSDEVLVHYNPKVREEGELTQSRLQIAASPIGSNDLGSYYIRPGVHRMSRVEWNVWATHPSAEIAMMRSPSAGILRVVAETTSLVEIYKADPYAATEILRNTSDADLLRYWMDSWEEMDQVLRDAMSDKSEKMATARVAPTKFVFGRPVAA